MTVNDAIKRLQKYAEIGYGETEIELSSYADIGEQPTEIDDIRFVFKKGEKANKHTIKLDVS